MKREGIVTVELIVMFTNCEDNNKLKDLFDLVIEPESSNAGDPGIIECSVVSEARIEAENGEIWDRNGDPGISPSCESEYYYDSSDLLKKLEQLDTVQRLSMSSLTGAVLLRHSEKWREHAEIQT